MSDRSTTDAGSEKACVGSLLLPEETLTLFEALTEALGTAHACCAALTCLREHLLSGFFMSFALLSRLLVRIIDAVKRLCDSSEYAHFYFFLTLAPHISMK